MNYSARVIPAAYQDNQLPTTTYITVAIFSLTLYRYIQVVLQGQKHQFWLGDWNVLIPLVAIWKYQILDSVTWIAVFTSIATIFLFETLINIRSNPSKTLNDYPTESFLIPPLFLRCQTSHTRLFPTKHSFSYSYLLTGIPVRWKGSGSILSTSSDSWFSVNFEDYLQRGHQDLNLHEKLDLYLKSQDISPGDYSFAYLVTAPRFLGFSFNPVSFWYLYGQNKELSAMILEVNNTFDERRMYFLKNNGKETFKQVWDKDFHVSPFNDRLGTYSLIAKDPVQTKQIDNTITLMSEDGKPKIVAKVYSTNDSIDPNEMGAAQLTSFILQWSWVGFLTNLRILREARKLWVKRLQVFYRPEPLQSNIGRTATIEETVIEKTFCLILQDLGSKANICFDYGPAAGLQNGRQLLIGNDSAKHIKFQVGTPNFYSQLAIAQELDHFVESQVDGPQSTFWTDNAEPLSNHIRSCKRTHRSCNNHTQLRGTINLILSLFGFPCYRSEISEFEQVARPLLRRQEFNALSEAVCTIQNASHFAFGFTGLWQFYKIIFRWSLTVLVISKLRL